MTTMYANETPEGYRYRTVLWSTDVNLTDGWYVHDTKRNKFIYIGRAGAKRVNYFDKAIEFCKSKQEAENVSKSI